LSFAIGCVAVCSGALSGLFDRTEESVEERYAEGVPARRCRRTRRCRLRCRSAGHDADPLPAHGTPAKIELSATSGVGEHGGTATVTARVLDAYSLLLPDVSVTFSADTGHVRRGHGDDE
jgi:hypothetical protein